MQLSSNQILMVNLLTNVLLGQGIPFDLAYTAGSRKEAPVIQITVHVTPTVTVNFTVSAATTTG